MKRFVIVLVIATLLCVLALPAYSISTTVSRCAAVAQQLLDHADPLDRNPPPRVAAAIDRWIGLDKLGSAVATLLLDRLACSGKRSEGADWLVSHPMLSWQLEREFDQRALIAIYAGSADMQNGVVGINNGARLLYSKNVDRLDDGEVACLMQRATGRPIDVQPSWPATPHYPQTPNICPSGLQAVPPPTEYYARRPVWRP